MLLTHLYALAGAGVLLTAAWLFKAHKATNVTTLGAFLSWSLVALLGGDAEIYDATNETVVNASNTTLAVETTGEFVAAPLPAEARFFATFWALLSVVALILHVVWGAYPPDDGTQEDTEQ